MYLFIFVKSKQVLQDWVLVARVSKSIALYIFSLQRAWPSSIKRFEQNFFVQFLPTLEAATHLCRNLIASSLLSCNRCSLGFHCEKSSRQLPEQKFTRCQFHLPFTQKFCANILAAKNYKAECNQRKAAQLAFIQKMHV